MKKITLLCLTIFFFLSSCQKKLTTTPYEFALLSAHVYDDEEPQVLPTHFQPFLDFDTKNYKSQFNIDFGKVINLADKKDWGTLVPYLGVKAFSKGGYFGRAYLNTTNQKIIIAHRGTDLDIKINKLSVNQLSAVFEGEKLWDFLMDLDDDYDIFDGKIPQQQFKAAQHFVQKVKEDYKEKYNAEPVIIHTGHSLGAILAELCAVQDNVKAITFESPGSKPLASQLPDSQSLNLDNPDITTYIAEPNQINSLHEHLGKVVQLYKKSNANSFHSESEKMMSLKQHPINELIKRFDKESGQPILEK